MVFHHRDGRRRPDRKLTEALSASETRFRAVLETAVNPIIVMGEDRLIRMLNGAALEMFGYRSDELVGQNVTVLMPPPYREAHDGYVDNYQRTGHKKIIGIGREVVALRKDGSTFPIHLSVGEADLPEGKLYTGIMLDLSEQKRLEQKLQESSEDEQRRIGRDIHDDICQQLAGLSCLISVLRSQSTDAAKLAENWDEIEQMVRDTNSRARELARGLVPVILESEGLVSALEELAASKSHLFDIDCRFTTCGGIQEPCVDVPCRVHLFRIAQEAVRNAVRHGQATRVDIALERDAESICLSIRDNGSGFDESGSGSEPSMGMGLLTMKHRAQMVSGDLSIDTPESGGTLVRCQLRQP